MIQIWAGMIAGASERIEIGQKGKIPWGKPPAEYCQTQRLSWVCVYFLFISVIFSFAELE